MKIRIDFPNFQCIMSIMIKRQFYIEHLSEAMRRSPVTALLGPRQCGKTTLARMFSKDRNTIYFDLESQADKMRLQNPELALNGLKGMVILDEIQEMPELFRVLRVLADRPGNRSRFLILGSASPDLMKKASETLAGRVEFVELTGFTLSEINAKDQQKLWLRGGFPRSFLAPSNTDSSAWLEGFIRTFLERDIPQLGISIPSAAMRRFWTMLAHYHGQIWNASDLGRAMGLSDKTMRAYLDILTGTFMVRQLMPWHENLGKRQVKAPKIYFRDSGILHQLLSLNDFQALSGHPRVGASWEGFALEQTLNIIGAQQVYFWSTYSGAELDLFFLHKGRRYGVEFKYSEAPFVSKSMRSSIETLKLNHLWIVYPGKMEYPVDKKITVHSLKNVANLVNLIK